jgi:hypothetical protein
VEGVSRGRNQTSAQVPLGEEWFVGDLGRVGAVGGASGQGQSEGQRPGPDRRRVLTAGAAGIVSFALPSAVAAATGGGVAPSSAGTLTFSEVSESGFTVSWDAV